jgi:hypothetical protein
VCAGVRARGQSTALTKSFKNTTYIRKSRKTSIFFYGKSFKGDFLSQKLNARK